MDFKKYACYSEDTFVARPGKRSLLMKATVFSIALAMASIVFAPIAHAVSSGVKEPLFGVVKVWKSGNPESDNHFGPGDVISVRVKDLVGWIIRRVDVTGDFDDDSLKSDAALQKIVRNHAFEFVVLFADAVKNVVEGDARELNNLIGEKNTQTFVDTVRSEYPQYSTYRTTKNAIEGPLLPDLLAAPAMMKLEYFAGIASLLPEKPEDQIQVIHSVEKFRDKLYNDIRERLRLKIDDLVFENIGPLNPFTATNNELPASGPTYEDFRFALEENDKDSPEWGQLRKIGLLPRLVTVTLVAPLANKQLSIDTNVSRNPVQGHRTETAYLVIASFGSIVWALGVYLFVVVLFSRLAARTGLLCETNGKIGGDGLAPYSLARAQMAFWFLAVVGATLFLWIATGQLHILNETCLWLIGIGSGTALGSAIIAQSDVEGKPGRFWISRLPKETADDFGARLKLEADKAQALASVADASDEVKARADALACQLRSFAATPKRKWKRVFEDWLTDNQVYSFHRYQMFVWTIILGTIFVTKVLKYRELPTFDGTMLALMGITSGTYLGFKLQDSK
jgi:hypothetical protein